MSGDWTLSRERSRFSGNPHPSNVFLHIEHNEPKLKYSGVVNHANEGHIIDFDFDGVIDGREHVIRQDNGDRRVTFTRVNDRQVRSVTKFSEGEVRSVITLSGDGRSLERRMNFRGRDGKSRSWVEVYEKK